MDPSARPPAPPVHPSARLCCGASEALLPGSLSAPISLVCRGDPRHPDLQYIALPGDIVLGSYPEQPGHAYLARGLGARGLASWVVSPPFFFFLFPRPQPERVESFNGRPAFLPLYGSGLTSTRGLGCLLVDHSTSFPLSRPLSSPHATPCLHLPGAVRRVLDSLFDDSAGNPLLWDDPALPPSPLPPDDLVPWGDALTLEGASDGPELPSWDRVSSTDSATTIASLSSISDVDPGNGE